MATTGAAQGARVARLQVDKAAVKGAKSRVMVSVPPKVNAKELGSLQNNVIDVIKGLTGCPCLSGAVDVIFRDEFSDVINVELR
jgi:hypothetical protein